MNNEDNSNGILNKLKTIFKPKQSEQKDTKPKLERRWIYRNE